MTFDLKPSRSAAIFKGRIRTYALQYIDRVIQGSSNDFATNGRYFDLVGKDFFSNLGSIFTAGHLFHLNPIIWRIRDGSLHPRGGEFDPRMRGRNVADNQRGHMTGSIDCLQSDVEINCVLGKYEMISVGPGIRNAVLNIDMISRVYERRPVHGE